MSISIAGTGVITSLGRTLEENWSQILQGATGLKRQRFAWSSPDVSTSAEQWNEWAGLIDPEALEINSVSDLSRQVCQAAIESSGDLWNSTPSERRGLIFGLSKPDFRTLPADGKFDQTEEQWSLSTLFPQSVVQPLRTHFGVDGPSSIPVAACATGAIGLFQATQWIDSGLCDAVLVGSADRACHPMIFGSYHRLGVLQSASLHNPIDIGPFCLGRSGFSLGEGAGAMVLTRKELAPSHSRQVLGIATGSDPTGLTVVEHSGKTLAKVIELALARARVSVCQIKAINVHGTGTDLNDLAESNAIAKLFGDPQDQPRCWSFKPAIGHLLGAASSVELVLTLEALRTSTLPPTLARAPIDPDCPVHLTPKLHSPLPSGPVLKLALGFGGHLVAVVLG